MDSLIQAFTNHAYDVANIAFWLNFRNAFVAWLLFTILLFAVLRFADKVAGIKFRESFDKIESDPQALAHYFGERHKSLAISGAIIIAAVFLL